MTQLSDGKEKADVIDEYQQKYQYNYFVETGTSFAGTLTAVPDRCLHPFKHLFSFEFDHAKYLRAIEHTWIYDNITVIYGDSGIHLGRFLDFLNEPCIIFLDAHSAEPEDSTPIREELSGCLYRGNTLGKKHVILIDDARLFGAEGWETWPYIEWIKSTALLNHYNYEIKDDIIRLEPFKYV
jgi:hypothetical protein